MPRFNVYEVQEITETKIFLHIVEAADPEEAVSKAKNGDRIGEIEDQGRIGEPEYGRSGWAVHADNRDQALTEAHQDMLAN
jgi:hypothetical protein